MIYSIVYITYIYSPFSFVILVLINISINRMSHGNASPDDARRVSHWIDQETQTRIGIRACLSDLRRERDKIAEAFEKIQQDRKQSKEKRQDFESLKRSQQQHCDRLHFILDGNLKS